MSRIRNGFPLSDCVRVCQPCQTMRGGRRIDADREAAALSDRPAYLRDVEDVVSEMGSDSSLGLTAVEASARLSQSGPNEILGEPPPSVWAVALGQLRDPMNIMLVAVVAVSVAIGEVSTGLIVALLILLNVVLGSRQELKARASIDALSNLQVPQAKVVRDGSVELVAAAERCAGRHRAAGGG